MLLEEMPLSSRDSEQGQVRAERMLGLDHLPQAKSSPPPPPDARRMRPLWPPSAFHCFLSRHMAMVPGEGMEGKPTEEEEVLQARAHTQRPLD